MASCSGCAAALETPLVCPACGTLQEAPAGGFEALGPFALLGLAPRFALDPADARRRMLRLGRLVHPDYFAAAGEKEKQRAEAASAALNWAHRTLAEEVARADWLVRARGGPSEADEREMPKPFLLQVLEWKEALEEARASGPGSPERAALAALGEDLRQRRAASLARIETLLDGAQSSGPEALRAARQELNAVRYLDRALGELESLRLEEATSR